MCKYIIMGVQGCGKGTQAKLLAKAFDLVHISVGDIFRWHIQSHTKLAARIGRHDVGRRIGARRHRRGDRAGPPRPARLEFGFILDGFPRNRRQAEFFLESYDINAVIQIDVADQVVLRAGA